MVPENAKSDPNDPKEAGLLPGLTREQLRAMSERIAKESGLSLGADINNITSAAGASLKAGLLAGLDDEPRDVPNAMR